MPSLAPLFAYFKHGRETGESLGDFCNRKGRDDLLAWTDAFVAQAAEAANAETV